MQTTANKYDVLLWPDGMWCYRYRRDDGMFFRADDFEVIEYGSGRWYEITDSVPYVDF